MERLPLIITCIIDDDQIYHYGMTRMMDYIPVPKKILQFYNGEQAIEYIKANNEELDNLPDLVFLDINMPVMDGWEFLDEFIKIKPKQKNTCIYMVSSSLDKEDIDRAASYGTVTNYLIKPITLAQLEELFKEHYTFE